MKPCHTMNKHQQRGVSLIVVLILMSAIFLMAAFGARLTLLGEKSSRNDRDRQIAFQAAEAALGDAEMDIMGPNSAANSRTCSFSSKSIALFVEGCGATDADKGLCLNTTAHPLYQSIDFEDTSSSRRYVLLGEFTGGRETGFATGNSALPALLPRYIVETLNYKRPRAKPEEQSFLVTAKGYGLNARTQVMLQSVIYKPATSGC